jgi:hypothetical protein
VIEPGPESLEEKLDELRTFAVAHLASLAVHEARALLAEQIRKFTLEPKSPGKITLKANGQIDFFGEEGLTRVGGAGGPAWTEAMPLPIAGPSEAHTHARVGNLSP